MKRKAFPLVSSLVVLLNVTVILMAVAGRTNLAVGLGVFNLPFLVRAALLDYHYKRIQVELIEELEAMQGKIANTCAKIGFKTAVELVKDILGYDRSK